MSHRRGAWAHGRTSLTLTFQYEVAERFVATVDSPRRSRLTITSQFVAEPKMLFRIPGNPHCEGLHNLNIGACFVPKPDVDVGVVKFTPRIEPAIKSSFEVRDYAFTVYCTHSWGLQTQDHFQVVEKVSRAAFIYRNKHIIKCFKTLYPEDMANDLAHELLRTCRIDPTTVSIRLGIGEFSDICAVYEKQCHQ